MEKFAIYRECMKNHAANLGSYAIDGCREYFPSIPGGDNPPELCAACGCHRSYHRRIESEPTAVENHSRYPRTSLRRMKQLARLKRPPQEEINEGEGRRRKSKFTTAQREAMREFAERLGWTLRDKKGRQEEIRKFCDGIGVTRYLFKTWVNNNKKYYAIH